MLKLYTAENSICTQKVFIVLHEKRLMWESIYIDLFDNQQYQADYLRLNPKGVVPTLVHEGRPIVESTLICEYLDAIHPDPSLTPDDPYGRARMRIWSKHIDEGVFEATREISFSAMFREKMKSMTSGQRNGRFTNIGDPERRARLMSTYELGVESPFVAHGIFAFDKLFEQMEEELSPGQDWLCGNQFTLGDVSVMPFAARLDYLGLLDIWISDRPMVQAWWTRAKARRSFNESIGDVIKPAQIAAMKDSGARIKNRIIDILQSQRRERDT
jgi:glutathione S-transferase